MKYDTPEYNAICKSLGFSAKSHYVKVTSQNTIEPNAGTRSEAFNLWKAVKASDMKPSKRFQSIAKRENF